MTLFEFQNITSAKNVCTDNNRASDIPGTMATAYTASEAVSYYNVILLTALLVVIIFVIYKCYWSPVFLKKELTDIGFEHVCGVKDRVLNVQRMMNARRVGHKLPPPYPNGWYALAESSDLKIGSVVPVDALGLNLVVYRGEDGTARVVDAYCPHLGAHLGVGGSVSGNCIRCPFHHWTFGENGDCVGILGVDKVPKGISIKTWPTMEVDGAVWIWYDAEGRSPLWTVEPNKDVAGWGCRGKHEFIVSAHIQDIPENGADVAHLKAIHMPSVIWGVRSKHSFLNQIIGHHVWNAEWKRSSENHIAIIKLEQVYKFMKINFFPVSVTIQQIGPSHVRLFFNLPMGPVWITQSVTPLGPLLQKIVHRVYSPFYNPLTGLTALYGDALQFGRDVLIWNHKQHIREPVYAKTDKTIRTFRTWFSQFYSEHSIPFKDSIQNPLDW